MSINPRQWIVQTLYNDLNKIKVINGYNYDIQEVFKNYINLENIPIPAIWFELIAESKNNDSESRRFFNSQLTILIGAYTSIPNNELRNVADCSEKMIADLMACINKVKLQSSTLDTFPSKIKWDIKSIEPYLNPELQGIVENRIFVNIEYLDSPDIVSRLNNDLPDTPTISTPLNGATVTTLYPQFQWDSVSGALSYQIHVSSDNSFNSININQNYLVDNSFTVPLEKALTNGNIHYVRVRAYNNVGYSDWSSTHSFIVNSTQVTPLNWNQISSSVSWWNTYASSGMIISSGISALLDQIASRRLSQGTSGRRPSLSGNAYGSLSSAYFNPLTATESYVLGFNDNTGIFDWSNTSTGTFMFVMMSMGNYFDFPSQYNCVVARANTSFGGQMAFIRGVNTGPIGYTYGYPGTSGDYMTIPCATGVPHQIIVSHSGSAHNVWIDGIKLYANKKYSNLSITNNANTYLNIGAYYNDASSHANGKYVGHIFEAGFATASLTSGQVASLYEGFKQRFNIS